MLTCLEPSQWSPARSHLPMVGYSEQPGIALYVLQTKPQWWSQMVDKTLRFRYSYNTTA